MPELVLIADDHPLMREALARAVGQAFPGVEVVETDGFARLREVLAGGPEPDIVLLDLHMPGMEGFIGLMMLRSEHPSVPVLVVSAAEDAATVSRAVALGAAGFVPKSAPVARVAEAIRTVLAGGVWMPSAAAPAEAAEAMAERAVSLTPQQLRVLSHMAAGLLNKQIAWEMGVAEQTVKDHVSAILRRLGATNRTQAVLLASRLALREPPPPD